MNMSSFDGLGSLKQAIAQNRVEARAHLLKWLASEPLDPTVYVEIAGCLTEVEERNLAHLVVHRGLALFPENDCLSLLALRWEHEARPSAA